MTPSRHTMTVLLIGGALLASGAARAAQPIAPGCADIVAALDQSGGTMSADEIAKKTSTNVETVRSCTDQWRASMKDPKGPAAGKQGAVTPGCAKVVDVLDQNPGLSADEVAKKSSVDVETVRNCTDQWRKTMPQ